MALLNAWLLRWIVADEYSEETISRYVWLLTLLVFLEAPVATLPTTALLGRAMFLQDLSWRTLLADLRQVAPGILWTQGIARGGLLSGVLMAGLRPSFELTRAEVWLPLLATYSILLRMTRPFINEIVLLERTPILPHAGRTVTIGRRVRSLHRPNTGDLIGRWITAAAAAIALTFSLTLTLWFVVGVITHKWTWGPIFVQLILPIAFWLAAIYTTVVKFMNYLDLRIRREGWEVELKVRAAAQELQGLPV